MENTELSLVVGFIFHQSKGKSYVRRRDTSYKEIIGQNPRPKVINGTRIFVLFCLLAKLRILESKTLIPLSVSPEMYVTHLDLHFLYKKRVSFLVSLNLKLTSLDILLIVLFHELKANVIIIEIIEIKKRSKTAGEVSSFVIGIVYRDQ